MLRQLSLLLLLIFVSGCNFAQETTLPLTVELKLDKLYEIKQPKGYFQTDIDKNHYEISGDSAIEKRFEVEVTIRNSSKKSVFIWLMYCSWEDNFLVNNNYMSFHGSECDKNFPRAVKIKAGDSITNKTTLIKSIKFDYPDKYSIYGKQVETTKVGLIIINDIYTDKYSEYEIAMEDKSRWSIIWSNPLYLLTSEEANPKPVVIPVYGPKKNRCDNKLQCTQQGHLQ